MSNNHASQSGLLMVQNRVQKMITLGNTSLRIGRKSVEIVLDDSRVSSEHARIDPVENSGYRIVDLGSTNGTYVNRRKVEESLLVDQDVIEIGSCSFCFFQNVLDYHGPAEEMTLSTKSRSPQRSDAFTTSTKTLELPRVQLKVLKGENEQRIYEAQKVHIIIGRGEVDIPILDLDASRSHALIEVLSPEIFFLKDLGSTNGTFLNGEKIKHIRMRQGDKIQVGETILEFQVDSSPPSMR